MRLSNRVKTDSKRYIYRCRTCGQHFKAGIDLVSRLPAIITLTVVLTLITGLTLIYFYSDSYLDPEAGSISNSTVKKTEPIKSHL